MYQQNGFQKQAFGSQQHNQQGQQQVYWEEEDLAHIVLSELKRMAREYTTAVLEAANPQVRQTFQSLLQKTLQDQAAVFQEIQKLGGYPIQAAEQQQIQQDIQKHNQCLSKLQSFIQHNLNQATTVGGRGYQQQNQSMAPLYQQSHTQNQAAALQQTSYQPSSGINNSAYPNAVYNQGFSQENSHVSGNNSHSAGENSHVSRQHEGSKYSF